MNEDQIFIYDGEEYSKDQVLDAASQFGMTLEDYVNTHGLTVKKEAVVEGATAGPSRQAPVTASKSVGTSSELPEFAEKPTPARAQTDIDLERKRGGNQQLTKADDYKADQISGSYMNPETKKAADRIKSIIESPLSAQELEDIESKLQPRQEQDTKSSLMYVGSTGPGNFNMGGAGLKTVVPYDDYKEAAIEQLKRDGGNPESKEAVDEVAKDLMRQELTRLAYKAKIDDVLREYEDNVEDAKSFGDYFSSALNWLGELTSSVGAAASGVSYEWESSGEKRYSTGREQLSGYIEEETKKAELSAKESARRIGVSTAQLEAGQIRLDTIKENMAKAETEEEYNTHLAIFNQELLEVQALYDIYKQDVGNIEKAMPWLTRGGMASDLAIRSYDQGDVFKSRYDAWLARTIAGVATFTETMALKAMEMQVPGALSPELVRSLYQTPAEEVEDVLLSGAEWSDKQVRYHQSYLEAEDWQDFLDASVDLAGDQIGQLGLMAMTGGTASSVIIGSSVAGQKMQDMNEQRKLGADFTDAQYYGSALLYGIAEAGSEYITFKQLGRNIKVMKEAVAAGAVTTDQIRNAWYNNLLSLAKTKGYDVLEEGGTESISQLAQNITDIYILDNKSVNVFDGVDESFVSGAMMSLMMSAAPGAAVGMAKVFNTRSEVEKATANHNRILELQAQQVKIKEQIDQLDKDGITGSKRDKLLREHSDITSTIEDLYMANTALMYTGIERIDKLTAAEKSEVLSVSKDITDLKQKVNNIVASAKAAGKSVEDIRKLPEYQDAQRELAVKESDLYDMMDFANDAVDKQKAWNALEQFSLENNGIPGHLISLSKEDWKDDLKKFITGTSLYQYYSENFGEDVAQAVRLNASQFVKEAEQKAQDGGVLAFANRQMMSVQVERDGQVVEIQVPEPMFIVSRKGSWKHESAHVTLFNNLMNKGGNAIMTKISNTLSNGIQQLYKLDPEKYGALNRYSKLRRQEYSALYGSLINPIKSKIKELENRKAKTPGVSALIDPALKKAKEQLKIYESIIAEEHAIAVLEYIASTNTKIGKSSGIQLFKGLMSDLGITQESYDISNANDMFRMLRTFNKRFDAGKTRRSFKALDRLLGETRTSSQLSKAQGNVRGFVEGFLSNVNNSIEERGDKLANKVNEIYAKEGASGIFEIGQLYGGMIRNAMQKRKYLPNYDVYKEDIESDILYGDRGLMDLVSKFDPSKGIPLAAYINKYLPARMSEIIERTLGKNPQFMADVSEVQIDSGSDIDTQTDEIYDTTDETAPVYSKVRRLLGLTPEQMNRVRGSVLTNLSYNPEIMETRKWVPSVFLSNLLEGFKTDLFSLLKGTENSLFPKSNKDWFVYAENMYEWISDPDIIPLSTFLRHKVDIFYKEKLDPVTNKPMRLNVAQGNVSRAADPLAGNKVWERQMPTKEEWMAWVRAEGINPKTGKEYSWTTVGTRKDALATALARHMALDAVMEVLANPKQEAFDPMTGQSLGYTMDVFDKWETQTGEVQNTIQATAQVAYIINRDPNLLFNLKSGMGVFDIANEVAKEVNNAIKGGMKDPIDAMIANEGDFATQKAVAETYAREIIAAMERLAERNIINSPSPAVQKQIVEQMFQANLRPVTSESEVWKGVLRAGMQAAQARINAQAAAAEAKANQRKKDASEAVVENTKETQDKLNRLDMMNKEWNDLMSESFKNTPKKDIARSTADSIYSRKPWWKKIHSMMSPRAEDFFGLLYWTMGKGQVGEKMREFYIKNLLEPFNAASSNHDAARVGIMTGFKALNRSYKSLVNLFDEVVLTNTEGMTYTLEDVIKVKLWSQLGYNIPDIDPQDLNQLLDTANNTKNVGAYVDGLLLLFKKSTGGFFEMEKPKEARGRTGGTRTSWDAVPISSYVLATLNGDVRKQLMKGFSENADAIFTEYNLNKLEAMFGSEYVDALKNSIEAMNSGRAPFNAKNKLQRGFEWWYNGSIGMIMFLNLRSAVLQLVSTPNYINWTDNNPLKMTQAMLNPKRYAQAFSELMNSDFMVVRRNSGKIDVEMTDIEEMIQNKNFGQFYSTMLKYGYLLTRYADSAAILLGGTALYVNRIDTYQKQGMSLQDAKNKAFNDFREITETNQQSARQDKLSSEQRSNLGRIVLAFGNTSMQYSRIMLKSAKDIINGRGDLKTNLSKIMYYGMVQNAMFTMMQQGIFKYWLDDDDEEDAFKQFSESDDAYKVLDSMFDNVARGFGIYGAVGVAMKKTIKTYSDKYSPDYKPKFGEDRAFAVAKAASSISPALSYKLQKISDFTYNASQRNRLINKAGGKGKLEYEVNMTAVAGEFFFNIPLRRLMTKYDNIMAAYQNEYNMAFRVANVLGWPDWQLDPEVSKARQKEKFENKVDEQAVQESDKEKTRRLIDSGGNKEKLPSRADKTKELLKGK